MPQLTLLDGTRVFAIPLDVPTLDEGPDGDDPASRPAQPRVTRGFAPQVVYGETRAFLHDGHGVVAGGGACRAGKRNGAMRKEDLGTFHILLNPPSFSGNKVLHFQTISDLLVWLSYFLGHELCC